MHLSEVAFYAEMESIITGLGEALVPDGLSIMETTANGFNYFKEVWDESEMGIRPYKTHFFGPEWEYSKEFLAERKSKLGRMFMQEYPMTPEDAFLTSGECFFDVFILKSMLKKAIKPIENQYYALP